MFPHRLPMDAHFKDLLRALMVLPCLFVGCKEEIIYFQTSFSLNKPIGHVFFLQDALWGLSDYVSFLFCPHIKQLYERLKNLQINLLMGMGKLHVAF